MKKIILLALLAIVSVSAFARKSYITVSAHLYHTSDSNPLYLNGDVPNGIANISYDDINKYWRTTTINACEVLNILSEYGYEVEQITSGHSNNYDQYLLSKEIPSNSTGKDGDVNKDGRVNVSDVTALVNIILGIVRNNPSLLEVSR